MRPHPGLLLALFAVLSGCSSGPETKIDEKTQVELYRELALRWYQMDELDRAEDQVTKGLALVPDDEQFQLMLGWIRQRKGTRDDILVAERVFRKLMPSDDYRVVLGLASSLERKGLFFWEAADRVESGEQAAPDPQHDAQTLRQTAEDIWRESLDRYHETLQLAPDNARAMSGLQRVYSQLGDYEKSLQWAARNREVVRGEIEFRRRQLHNADLGPREEETLRDNLKKDEDALIANNLHAVPMLRDLGRDDEALALLDEIARIDPERAEVYGLRAQIYHDRGMWVDAKKNVDQFLLLSTDLGYDHPDVQRAYALRTECEREIELERLQSRAAASAADAAGGE